MNLKRLFIIMFLLFTAQSLFAKEVNPASFLLKANDDTSFMHYESHNLAYKALLQKDYANAHRIYLELAQKGDDRAEYNTGMMYLKGIGVERQKMDAYKWLRRASKHGNKEAALFFKQMNEKNAQQDRPEKKTKTAVSIDTKSLEDDLYPLAPTSMASQPSGTVKKTISTDTAQKDSSLLYLSIFGIILLIFVYLLFFKRQKSIKNKKEKTAQSSPLHRSQQYEITYAHISDYHNELLKQVNLSQLRANKEKMHIYHMFLYGVIDYFCQLGKFSDAEQQRIFSTHMKQYEGDENLTAIMQDILEGQRDPSMYHYQAAGGVSAKAWNEERSKSAPSMLKKVLYERRN